MQGYLLDTNIVAYWFDDRRPEHRSVVDRINALPDDVPLRVSVVTLGEIEYGHRAVSLGDTPIQARLKQFLADQFPRALEIRKATTIYYGAWRARLFAKLAPAGKKTKLTRPEQLVAPVTSRELGIQENDLWIAAQAMEHKLVLVTHDVRSMAPLRDVMDDGLRVDIEDWVGP